MSSSASCSRAFSNVNQHLYSHFLHDVHLKQAGLRRESRGVMGLKISFQRSRRKTGPVQAPSPSRESDSDEERSFDDINLNESNPFLPSNRETAVPHSLKPFIEEKADFCGHLNFYTDAVSCVTLQPNDVCFVCSVYTTPSEMFTCRVCMKSFHEGCLQKLGELSTEVGKLHAKLISKSAIGWSCYKCSNLSLLLTEEEMHSIMNLFDDYDVNQDTEITFDEYVRFKEKQYLKKALGECPEDIKAMFRDEFSIIDRDKTGTIDWWEFLNHESVKVLSKRDKKELVRILSETEVAQIQSKFDALDLDNDGKITEFEANAAFSDWFGKMELNEESNTRNFLKHSTSRCIGNDEAASHAQNFTMLVMEADSDQNRYVDWEEFLENEALYIIASRPNLPFALLMKTRNEGVQQRAEAK